MSSFIEFLAVPDGSERRVTAFNGVLSTLAAIAVDIAGTAGGVAAVLGVFGVWAMISGAAQLTTGLYRRGPALGQQWPTLISSGLSFLVGAFYVAQATGRSPSLDVLSVYATGGGVFFIAQGRTAGLEVTVTAIDHAPVEVGRHATAISRLPAVFGVSGGWCTGRFPLRTQTEHHVTRSTCGYAGGWVIFSSRTIARPQMVTAGLNTMNQCWNEPAFRQGPRIHWAVTNAEAYRYPAIPDRWLEPSMNTISDSSSRGG
ncbi:DUF308 domain-containing protein [Nocardia vinacea]|uniref:DUF308 domain-containing protein n=1 Tax=Nocardia vinacea TaxID=96468 RepID=UPI00342AA464